MLDTGTQPPRNHPRHSRESPNGAQRRPSVIPAPPSVIPAKAGTQYGAQRRPLPRPPVIPAPLIPAKAGTQYGAQRRPRSVYNQRAMTNTRPRKNPLDPCVYIMASDRNGTIYTGVTSNLVQRVWQHKADRTEGFTKEYEVHHLVWYEQHATMLSAISREKAIKKWNRRWKLELIESLNPGLARPYEDIA